MRNDTKRQQMMSNCCNALSSMHMNESWCPVRRSTRTTGPPPSGRRSQAIGSPWVNAGRSRRKWPTGYRRAAGAIGTAILDESSTCTATPATTPMVPAPLLLDSGIHLPEPRPDRQVPIAEVRGRRSSAAGHLAAVPSSFRSSPDTLRNAMSTLRSRPGPSPGRGRAARRRVLRVKRPRGDLRPPALSDPHQGGAGDPHTGEACVFNGTWEVFGPENNPHNEHAEA